MVLENVKLAESVINFQSICTKPQIVPLANACYAMCYICYYLSPKSETDE